MLKFFFLARWTQPFLNKTPAVCLLSTALTLFFKSFRNLVTYSPPASPLHFLFRSATGRKNRGVSPGDVLMSFPALNTMWLKKHRLSFSVMHHADILSWQPVSHFLLSIMWRIWCYGSEFISFVCHHLIRFIWVCVGKANEREYIFPLCDFSSFFFLIFPFMVFILFFFLSFFFFRFLLILLWFIFIF